MGSDKDDVLEIIEMMKKYLKKDGFVYIDNEYVEDAVEYLSGLSKLREAFRNAKDTMDAEERAVREMELKDLEKSCKYLLTLFNANSFVSVMDKSRIPQLPTYSLIDTGTGEVLVFRNTRSCYLVRLIGREGYNETGYGWGKAVIYDEEGNRLEIEQKGIVSHILQIFGVAFAHARKVTDDGISLLDDDVKEVWKRIMVLTTEMDSSGTEDTDKEEIILTGMFRLWL